jgi:cyclophilin family peptidyl-prolyl cis-trans isomerase/HEAT repeat protein
MDTHSPPLRRPCSCSLLDLASRLLLVVLVAACDPAGPDAAEPPPLRLRDGLLAESLPLRPRDGLLADPTLQGVVDLQVQRDGPALAAMLTHERADVRARAALALASVQAGDALLPLLVAASEDADAHVRRDAAFAVGQLGRASSVSELAAAFANESDAGVRDRLLEALGKIAAPDATSALLSADVIAPEQGRRALALAVNGAVKGMRSQAAQDFLLERLDDPDPAVREGAAYYFSRQADPFLWLPRISRVRNALSDYRRDDPAAMYLVQALGAAREASDTERLADWAGTATDWRIRSNAMVALVGRELEPAVREALMDGLDDVSEHVAMNAAIALAGSAQPPSVLAGIESWIDRNPTRAVVIEPLIRMLAIRNEREFVLGWLDALDETDEAGWRVGLIAIGSLGGREALDRLRVAVNSPSESVAGAAVGALSQRWGVDKGDAQLREIYFAIFAEALNSGMPQVEFAAGQILTDPLLFSLGSQQLLLDMYQRKLSENESREAAEFLRLVAVTNAPGAEALLREALQHPAAVVRLIAASGIQRLTGEVVDVDTEEDAPEVRRGDVKLEYDPTVIDWPYLATIGDRPRIAFDTKRGRVLLELDTEQAPHAVQTMTRLVSEGRFDGVPFHRVVANFVAQGGDVSGGDGRGGPGFQITSEFNELPYVRGAIGLASAGKDTEGSQFFLAHTRLPHLDGGYTVFGWVVEGLGVMDSIMRGDEIVTASLVRGG